MGAILGSLAVSTIASVVIGEITDSPILGALAGSLAGFGMSSLMSTGTVAGTADVAGTAIEGGAQTFAYEPAPVGEFTPLSSGAAGAEAVGAPVIDMSTNATLGGSTVGGGGSLLGGSGGLIDAVKQAGSSLTDGLGQFFSGDGAKEGLMKLGGDLMQGYSKGKELEAQREILDREYADKQKLSKFGLRLNDTREDMPSQLQAGWDRIGTVSRPDGSPVVNTAAPGPLPTSGMLNTSALTNVSPNSLQQENALLRSLLAERTA